MLTITEFARQYNVSRTTILYYERAGLLAPATRTENGYRTYGKKECVRLKSILSYRSFGIPVSEIAPQLESESEPEQEQVLRKQFNALEDEIKQLRKQQKAIVTVLNQDTKMTPDILSKERWTELMKTSGLSDEDMVNWHIQFEKLEPEAHQIFLESLGIEEKEIVVLRKRFNS